MSSNSLVQPNPGKSPAGLVGKRQVNRIPAPTLRRPEISINVNTTALP